MYEIKWILPYVITDWGILSTCTCTCTHTCIGYKPNTKTICKQKAHVGTCTCTCISTCTCA